MNNPERHQNDQENINNPEFSEISDESLIEILKLGAEKPEAQEMLRKWSEQEELKIKQIDSKLPAIRFNFRRGLLYAKAGYIEEALDSLDDALTQARQEDLLEPYEEIEQEIKNLKDLNT